MIKLLLVEDNPVDAELTQDLLAEWPHDRFEITHAAILADGLVSLSRNRFDVVLLDLSLPDTHGLSTVTQVLATSPGVPVVVLSGHDDHPLALKALQHGAQDYLVKGEGGTDFLARSILYAIERKRAQERLTYLAQHDQLTGLINRALFRDRLVHAMARSKRKDLPLAIMLLDLDRFKTVNDTLGHDVGDQLLKVVAMRLEECVREVDTVARMGGDEFTAILEGIAGEEDVLVVAKRIVASLSTPFEIGPHRISIGVSIGITLYPSDDEDIDELLRHADKAMYAAKHQGGNRFHFHSPTGQPPSGTPAPIQ
ncbi:MAG: GGDEF domain-containing response regulator [Nitrospira sp.]|nr:GGDEF domain-containing response regulator [Nitrospira sp.]